MTTQQISIYSAAPVYADLRVPWHQTNGVRHAKTTCVISTGDVSADRLELKTLGRLFIDANGENLLSESGYLTSDGLISG